MTIYVEPFEHCASHVTVQEAEFVDETETFVFIVCGILALILLIRWYYRLLSVPDFISPLNTRLPLVIVPAVCTLILVFILKTLASSDVRDSAIYIMFYTVMGLAVLGIADLFFPFFGISLRDDVVERRNGAASTALTGALVAVTLCYAGGNIGEGPGWWVVVIAAVLALIGLFGVWFILEAVTQITETITIDRDRAAGLRLAGYLVAAGLILGRAVAGDWVSLDATVVDFVRFGWPVVILVVVAIIVEIAARPTVDRPVPPIAAFGVVPAVAYIAGAAVVLVYLAQIAATPRPL